MQLLVIEDDLPLSAALMQILKDNGHDVDATADGETGLAYASTGAYDAIILDVMLPKMSGFDVASQIRRQKIATPILMLSARSTVADKIAGLDAGADDYMTKPFSPTELLAHLRALARRQGDVIFEEMKVGDLSLNLDSGDFSCNGKTIHLSYKEFAIARVLMGNPGQVISKQMLITKVWGVDSSAVENNVEAYISFLRKKLAHVESTVRIETLRKIGYRLVAETDALSC